MGNDQKKCKALLKDAKIFLPFKNALLFHKL